MVSYVFILQNIDHYFLIICLLSCWILLAANVCDRHASIYWRSNFVWCQTKGNRQVCLSNVEIRNDVDLMKAMGISHWTTPTGVCLANEHPILADRKFDII